MLLRELKRLQKDEEGASLVFAAMTLFTLTLSILYVYQIGMISTDRIQMQNAADAAAYAAAQVEANSLNAIGQIQDGMAYLNYINLRFTVDAVVYDTQYLFGQHESLDGANRNAPGWVWMGKKGSHHEGPARYQHIRNIQTNVLPNAQTWVQDLHSAARVIQEATPELAIQLAAEVAHDNGATYIAVSEDMEQAFRVGGSDDHGFTEPTDLGDDVFHGSMHARYGRDGIRARDPDDPSSTALAFAVNHVKDAQSMDFSREPLELPDVWFQAGKGEKTDTSGGSNGPSTYRQVRLCWRNEDWIHSVDPHLLSRYQRFVMGAPNGHWHLAHGHGAYDLTNFPIVLYVDQSAVIPNDGEHGGVDTSVPEDKPGGHWPDQSHEKSNWATTAGTEYWYIDLIFQPGYNKFHHHAELCDTCEADTKFGKFTEIEKTANADGTTLSHELAYTGTVPAPLLMRRSLLRSGVTVVTWRPSHGIGDTLPGSDFGMLAVASASVGYMTPNGVVTLTDYDTDESKVKFGDQIVSVLGTDTAENDRYRNLFYSNQPERGVRFGARLVPVAWEFAYHPTLGPDQNARGLGDLLKSDSTRWYDENGADAASPIQTELEALSDVVTVNSREALEAFWH